MRKHIKTALEWILVGSGAGKLARKLNQERVAVLAYHNIVPDDLPVKGDRSLHLPESAFREQITLLSKSHEIVSLSSLLEDGAVNSARPRAVVTFDDAYSGAVSLGLGHLLNEGVPATMFVAPGLLGGKVFWWDALAGPESGAVSPEIRRFCLEDLEGRQSRILSWAEETGIPIHPVPDIQKSATEEQLSDALTSGLFSIGSHTWFHPNLCRVHGKLLEEELLRSKEWLQENLAQWYDPAIAYPYGLSSSPVFGAATKHYLGCFLLGGQLGPGRGWRGIEVPRINVPRGLSFRGFDLRISGFSRE